MIKLKKIISGGQTGADQGGLFAGRELGLETGGTAPKDWRTQAGPAPWLADFGLVESQFVEYSARTRQNVVDSDGTVIFGKISPGSRSTRNHCLGQGKPYLWIPLADASLSLEDIRGPQFTRWLIDNRIEVLNTAGNREEVSPGICGYVTHFIIASVRPLLPTEDKPYITVAHLFGVYHVNKMEWDARAEEYKLVQSRNCGGNKNAANTIAAQWAEREGLEVR